MIATVAAWILFAIAVIAAVWFFIGVFVLKPRKDGKDQYGFNWRW